MTSGKGKGKAINRSGQLEPRLESLPPEILELIAFYCADNSDQSSSSTTTAASTSESQEERVPATPPSHLHSLLLTNRRTYSILNTSNNTRLYARIFRSRFDVAAISRRYGPSAVNALNLTRELQKRCVILKRIKRAVSISKLISPEGSSEQMRNEMEENLWLAFMMMTENGER